MPWGPVIDPFGQITVTDDELLDFDAVLDNGDGFRMIPLPFRSPVRLTMLYYEIDNLDTEGRGEGILSLGLFDDNGFAPLVSNLG